MKGNEGGIDMYTSLITLKGFSFDGETMNDVKKDKNNKD